MEKALLIKTFSQSQKAQLETDIEEMHGLIDTAGAEVYGVVTQARKAVDPVFFIGKGKVHEIAEKYKDFIDLAIFDANLKPVQIRNIEKIIEKRIIDRTQLILDIFAQRAHTKEAILQVEYAQLNYLLPRLTGHGVELSRLGGGIGTRGPGETKLEVDRRKIKKRLQIIKKELEKIKEIRAQQRERRKEIPVPLVSIVGYTNAGKTMLLNRLTNAGMLSEDKLFATLDPKIKQYILPNKYKVLFSDTVGFIKNLPPYLIAAFRATMEEVVEADIILHLIDISREDYEEQKETVYDILKSIGAYEDKTIIDVYNKVDLLSEEAKQALLMNKNVIHISAKTGDGLDTLIAKIEGLVEKEFMEKDVVIPYNKEKIINMFYTEAVVLDKKQTEQGTQLKIKCMQKTFDKYLKLLEEV